LLQHSEFQEFAGLGIQLLQGGTQLLGTVICFRDQDRPRLLRAMRRQNASNRPLAW
jgi:hypothetical protein